VQAVERRKEMFSKTKIISIVILLAMVFTGTALAGLNEKPQTLPSKSDVIEKTKRLHIPFIANEGQVDERVAFYARTFGGTVFVTKDGQIVYSLPKAKKEGKTLDVGVIKEEFVNGTIKGVNAEDRSVTNVSYFIGNDPSMWRNKVSTYGLVNLGEVYKGIELKLKAYGNNVEKLFYVKPGAEPERIKIKVEGTKRLRVNEASELEVETELGKVRFSNPIAYQEINGKRVDVAVAYNLFKSELTTQNSQFIYGFTVGSYNPTKDLIIDPILQSTYLGGSGDDSVSSIAIDDDENVYVVGNLFNSTNFPGTSDGAQPSHGGGSYDGFVAKLDSTLTSLLQATYLGGSGNENVLSIAIDAGGNVYAAGATDSADFPGTSGGAQPSYVGSVGDGYVAKLNSTLTYLLQSTYLGGSNDDYVDSIDIDAGGDIYVAGFTLSTDFPSASGGAQPSHGGGIYDAFVTKLNPTLTAILQSTYLGGSGSDNVSYSNAIAINTSGNVYVVGTTASNDFPGASGGAYPSHHDGSGYDGYDGFVAKLDSTLTSILQSTYLGGSRQDGVYAITIMGGNIYVAGVTASTDFPGTSGGAQPSYGGGDSQGYDGFAAKLNATLTSLLQSTYLGGNGQDNSYAMAIGAGGDIYVAGATASTNLPGTSGGAQPSYGGGSHDGFVAKLDSSLAFTINYNLTVSISGTGSGTVTSDPAGINCGSDCSEDYTSGTYVTLTAIPDACSTFTGWSGACIDRDQCTVTMDAAKAVTATFDENYVFGGFQQPINSDGLSIFKAGSTIPVKIILRDCSGQSISTATVTIGVYKITNAILGTEEELLVGSSGSANTGNLFRYDATAGQYIYNLSTKSYTRGTYRVYAKPDNGNSYSVNCSLK